MLSFETGIDPRGVLTLETDLPESRYIEFHEAQAFYDELLPRIRALPGVRSAALAIYLPADGWFHSWELEAVGYRGDDGVLETEVKQVTPGYFRTLGIDLVAGRTFDEHDGTGPPVVVINESMARRFWPQGDAVGARLADVDDGRQWTIIGIVHDVRYRGAERDVPQVYMPYADGSHRWGMDVLVRTDARPEELAAPIRRLATSIDPEVTVFDVRTLSERLSGSLAEPRFRTLLLGSFGLAALALAVIGVYGVMAYAVARRARELGIRKALGASRRRVMLDVARRGLIVTATGLGIGTIGAYATLGVLQRYLFHVDARDPATILLAIAVLAAAAMLASYIPARRAARVDPLIALRSE
jgi:predicted permease